MILRPFQVDVKQDVYSAWASGARNVMMVMPTGAGKTTTFSSILKEHSGMACAIAHRQELVYQISMALAAYGVYHKIIGPTKIIKFIINEQIIEYGQSFYHPNAYCAVAGVDTLVQRADKLKHFLEQVTLWIQDEGHHVLLENKWGKAAQLMPNAKGLAVTATPCRADGKGLGRQHHGLMDALVEGPSMRWLIDNGYLTDYRIFCPPSDIDLTNVNITKAGDYNPQKLKQAAQQSHIVGDVVDHYIRLANGLQGITFATDVETAGQIAAQYNNRGIRAELVHAKTPDRVRAEIMRRYRAREILQLVNVDLFGEGVDVPAIEVCSMARPTQSYGLYVQQFGRALRIKEGKLQALIIDHVSNVVRHGLPDKEREWTLDIPMKKPRSKKPEDDIPLRYCVACTQPFERIHKVCPYCGHYHAPAERSGPEYVDGDLTELTPDVLAEMRKSILKTDMPASALAKGMREGGASEIAVKGAIKTLNNKQAAQKELREKISWWAGLQRHMGRDDSESYRLFYFLFGMDVLSAQTLGAKEALALADKINQTIGEQYGDYTRRTG